MFVFAPLNDSHIVAAFDCGIESLNHYLKNVARQHQARNLSRVFVVTEESSPTVLLCPVKLHGRCKRLAQAEKVQAPIQYGHSGDPDWKARAG